MHGDATKITRDVALDDVSSGFHSVTRYALISVVNMIKI